MSPKNAVPLLAAAAPAVAIVPPVLIVGALVAVGLLWLFSDEKKSATVPTGPASPVPPQQAPALPQETSSPVPVVMQTAARRVTREDLAEALAYGERQFTRKEAVAAIEALGFRKTAAYKALAEGGKFADLIDYTPDGLIEWKG